MSPQGQVLNFIEHLSEQPWSNYTKADYSIEQWHAACLIHQHEGAPTSKSQCKLPVKTPNGALNKNGVHAAAAALAGARGGVHASAEEKAKAASALRRYYSQMNEEAPPSLKQSNIEDFVEHYGKKGMKWGVRTAKTKVKTSSDYRKTLPLRNRKTRELSNKQIQQVSARINMEQNYRRLNPNKLQKGEAAVKAIMATVGTVASVYTFMQTPAGKAATAQVKKLLQK